VLDDGTKPGHRPKTNQMATVVAGAVMSGRPTQHSSPVGGLNGGLPLTTDARTAEKAVN